MCALNDLYDISLVFIKKSLMLDPDCQASVMKWPCESVWTLSVTLDSCSQSQENNENSTQWLWFQSSNQTYLNAPLIKWHSQLIIMVIFAEGDFTCSLLDADEKVPSNSTLMWEWVWLNCPLVIFSIPYVLKTDTFYFT